LLESSRSDQSGYASVKEAARGANCRAMKASVDDRVATFCARERCSASSARSKLSKPSRSTGNNCWPAAVSATLRAERSNSFTPVLSSR